jgi:hypothetical protein
VDFDGGGGEFDLVRFGADQSVHAVTSWAGFYHLWPEGTRFLTFINEVITSQMVALWCAPIGVIGWARRHPAIVDHRPSSIVVDVRGRLKLTTDEESEHQKTPKFERSRIWPFQGDNLHRIAPRGGIPPSTSSWTTFYLGGIFCPSQSAREPRPKLKRRF